MVMRSISTPSWYVPLSGRTLATNTPDGNGNHFLGNPLHGSPHWHELAKGLNDRA